MKFDATIPVLDMDDYFSTAKHKNFIEGLSHAMETVGFVAVMNSPVDSKTLDIAYAAAQEFYALPLEIKMQCHAKHLSGQRGYVLSEIAKGESKKDFKEFYHMSREYPAVIKERYGYHDNIWPAAGNFQFAMQNLIAALDRYAKIIGQALAESIHKDPEFFNSMTAEGNYVLRSIHYPANPPTDAIWAAAHTDIDLFSILPRATSEGLQVRNAAGEWIDVIVPDNAFIINAGDLLQNITNGVYKSSMHRVISTDQNKERFSMVAFIHTRPTDRLDPLPEFIQRVGKQKFANATEQELLSERLIELGLGTPDLIAEFAKSGAIERLIAVQRASPNTMRVLRAKNLASPLVLEALDNVESNTDF